MKKIMAMLLAFVMLFSFVTVANADDWDFLDKQMTNFECTMQMYTKLNKPLAFLEGFNEEAGFNVQYLVENLLNGKFNADVKADVADDLKAGKVYMGINPIVPIYISEDIKLDVNMKGEMWVEYDFSSAEAAKYLIVIKNPLNGKFFSMDFFEALADDKDELVESFEVITAEQRVEATELANKLFEEKTTREKLGDVYKMTITNNDFIDILAEIFKVFFENANVSWADLFGTADVNEAQITAIAKGLGLFGDTDAVVSEYRLDENGYVKEADEEIHFDFNIYEVCKFFGMEDYEILPFTKENSDIDFVIGTKAEYSRIDESGLVQMPVLTKENCVDLVELFMEDSVQEDYYGEYEPYQPQRFYNEAAAVMDRSGIYVGVDEYLDSAYWDEDSLTGSVEVEENGDVTIKISSLNFDEVVVRGNVNSDNYTINGMEIKARRPFKPVSGYNWEYYEGEEALFANIDIFSWILGSKIISVTTYVADYDGTDLTNPEYYIETVRNNPAYIGE